jgi:glycosyltransferase involved in cell wall biosynthesis
MTIYLYTKHFPPYENPVHHGVVKAVHGLATGLATLNQAVTVLSEDPQAAQIQTPYGYTHRSFSNPDYQPSLKLAPDLVQFIKTELTSEDLVILNGGFHLSVYAIARRLKQQGIPYVMAPHLTYDRQMFAKSRHRKYLYWQLCERYVLKHAQAVQVLNHKQATWLVQRGIRTKAIEVQNGFTATDLPPIRQYPWHIRSDDPVRLLFFGRLSRQIKGLDLLLEAFAASCHQSGFPALDLTLQGADAGDGAQLLQMAWDLGVSDRVRFLQPNYAIAPTELIGQQDILCLPSRSEGFGLAALEGMLAGRVLLVSESAGIADHVRASGCGIIVKPDAQSIQAGLDWLLRHRDRWPAMGDRGQRYAMAHLSWRKIAQQALPQYQSLAGRPLVATPKLVTQSR